MRPMEVFAFLTVAWVVEVLAGAVLSWLAKTALRFFASRAEWIGRDYDATTL